MPGLITETSVGKNVKSEWMYNQTIKKTKQEKIVFDIYSLPLHCRAGQEIARLPGLLVKNAPPKSHRNRMGELLFLFLTLEGDTRFPSSQMSELLEHLASVYYQCRGTATTAMRSVAESLNAFLLKRNQSGQESQQEIGIFNLAVLRRNQLFMIHAGDTHSFFLGKTGIQTFYEPFTAGRGLGVGRTIQLSYFQTETAAGDLLIFCPNPPESWSTGTLEEISRLPLGQIRRRILQPAPTDLEAVVIQFRQGQGRIYQPRQAESPNETQPGAVPVKTPVLDFPPVTESLTPAAGKFMPPPLDDSPAAGIPPESQPTPLPRPTLVPPHRPVPSTPAGDTEKPQTGKVAPRSRPQRKQPELKEKLADLWISAKAIHGRIKNHLNRFFARLLPAGESHSHTVSPKAMLAIAIIVPVVIALAASMIYFASGRNQQHQVYLNQALTAAAEADLTADPTLRASSWMQVLAWVDEAENYGQSESSRNLRSQAESKLDAILDITRLNFFPILSKELDKSLQITRMVATETEVYFLDGNQGNIYRLIQSGQNFEYSLDQSFKCGPGQVENNLTIQPLVDMVALQKKKFSKPAPMGATILAVDGAGNYLFCIPDLPPVGGKFQTPDNGWGEVKDVEITEEGRLYVLDPKNNAVWFIDFSTEKEISSLDYSKKEPRFFFDASIPVLSDVINLAYFEDAVYLLHNTGAITICDPRIFNQPTTCTEMTLNLADYNATQALSVGTGAMQPEFTQFIANSAPFSSLSILDSQQGVIFQFTARLKTLSEKFYPKFDPDYLLPTGRPTAFTIVSPGNRVILLAYGNQLYKAVP